MFHIPPIFILYGIAQIIHIVCTYYDHKNNKEEHSKHKLHLEKSNRKINDLESIIKNLEGSLEENLESKTKKQIENDLIHFIDKL